MFLSYVLYILKYKKKQNQDFLKGGTDLHEEVREESNMVKI